jgi:hypothetical protein
MEQQLTGASNVTFECPRSIPDKSTTLTKGNNSLLSLWPRSTSAMLQYNGWNTGSWLDNSAWLPSATAVICWLSDQANSDTGFRGFHSTRGKDTLVYVCHSGQCKQRPWDWPIVPPRNPVIRLGFTSSVLIAIQYIQEDIIREMWTFFFLPRCSHTWELAPAFGA